MPTAAICSCCSAVVNGAGLAFSLSGSGLGELLDGEAHDIYYIGGGQDRDQLLCAEDLVAGKREALHEAASRGAIVLGVCGGYQLLGESYTLGDNQLQGVGLLDIRTVREPGERLIGNIAIEVNLDGEKRVLAGFENHGGRTYLGPEATPLGRVLKGHGNDGRSGFEGARCWQHDRHLSPRSAVAKERMVCRLADRDGARYRRRSADIA